MDLRVLHVLPYMSVLSLRLTTYSIRKIHGISRRRVRNVCFPSTNNTQLQSSEDNFVFFTREGNLQKGSFGAQQIMGAPEKKMHHRKLQSKGSCGDHECQKFINNFIGKLLPVGFISDYINHPGRTVRLNWFRPYTSSWYLEDVLFDNFTKRPSL